jgi:hypothetical protein
MTTPALHEQALKDTQQRNRANAEQPMDWADAKRELRRPRR